MLQSLITLYGRVHFKIGNISNSNNKILARALNLEVGVYGYTLSPEVLDKLAYLSVPDFHNFRTELTNILATITGANSRHATLFKNFPYEIPGSHDPLMNKVATFFSIGKRSLVVGLSCGHVYNGLYKACPVCNFVGMEGVDHDSQFHEFENICSLKMLSFADDTFIGNAIADLLVRNSSLSAAEKSFVTENGKIFSAKIISSGKQIFANPFRETIPLIFGIFGETMKISSATDVMRIAYYLSDPVSDLSLKNNVRFSLSTSEKRKLLVILDRIDNLVEDMMRDRERWLRLGEILNPGSAKNTTKYKNVAQAFNALRNHPNTISTFNRNVEKNIRANKIDSKLLDILVTRPGEFMRRLDVLLRRSNDPSLVIDRLIPVLPNVPSKLLLEVFKYFQTRGKGGQKRVFFPKGNVNKMQIIADTRPNISSDVSFRLTTVLYSELIRRHATLPSLGNVFIDPDLTNLILPFNKRGDGESNVVMNKGSKYKMEVNNAPVIRLFVHWSEASDIDLSAVLITEDFKSAGHIAFTNLVSVGAYHSGDVRSGYSGASEFIDFELDTLRKRGVRYIVASVISFCGGTFDTFPCFTGFMYRDAVKSGQKFEPSSVAFKVDINAKNTSHTPVMFDIAENTVTVIDMAGGSKHFNAVAENPEKFIRDAMIFTSLNERKPTAFDLLDINIRARGKRVYDVSQADIVFSPDTIDLDNLTTQYLA